MDPSFYNAAMEGKVEVLSQNRDQFEVQLTPNKNNVLHISAFYGHTHCVNEILKNSPVLLNAVNVKGETPLHFAAREGHLAIVETIVERAKEMERERGFEVGKRILRAINEVGDTALHEAVQNRHLDVVKLLVKEDPEFVYKANNSRESPLYIAAEKGLDRCVAEILKTCISPSYDGPLGRTALHAAVIFNSQGSTQKLLEWKHDLSKKTDRNGWTALHHAARLGHVERAKQMLHFDVSLAYITTRGPFRRPSTTALHIAAGAGHVEVMKVLILMCPDCCEMVNDRGQNILHLAVLNERDHVISFILQRPFVSCLINQKDTDGNTPMHLLASSNCGNTDIIEHPRAETMVFNSQDLNPLDIACRDIRIQTSPNLIRRKLKKVGVNGQRTSITSDEKKKAQPNKYNIKDLRNLGNTHLIVAFAISDSIAMLFSSCAVVIHFLAARDYYQNKDMLVKHYTIAAFMILIAIIAMVLAFVTGVYAHSSALAISVCVMGCCGFLIHRYGFK